MKHSSKSRLTKAGAGLALFSGILANEASAQIEARKPIHPTPIVINDIKSSIISLMDNTHEKDADKRLNALYELEEALKEIGAEVLLKEVQQSIHDELQLQTLTKDIQSGGPEAVEKAAEQLCVLFLGHNNYFVRQNVQDILNVTFEGKGENDPRNKQQPSMEQYSATLKTSEPASTVEEWKQSKEVQALQKTLRYTLDRLQDEDYKERVKAQKEVHAILLALRKYMNPLPETIIQECTPQHLHGAWHEYWMDAEKRQRATQALTSLTKEKYADSALPPLRTTAPQLLQELHNHFQVDIRFADGAIPSGDLTIETAIGSNSYSQMLTEICRITNTYPVCKQYPHDIILMPNDSKDGNKTLVTLDGAVGVLSPGEDGKPDTMQLFTDPKIALLSLEKVTGTDTTLQLAPGADVEWDVKHSGSVKPTRTKKAAKTKESDSNATAKSIKVKAWVASDRNTEEISLKDDPSFIDGPHSIKFFTEQEQSTSTWKTLLNMDIYADKFEWPATPHTSDMHTYAAADAIHIEFYDKNGERIDATRGPMTIHQRNGKIQYTLTAEPVSAKISTFRKITEQEIAFPLDGSDSTRTTTESSIKTNNH